MNNLSKIVLIAIANLLFITLAVIANPVIDGNYIEWIGIPEVSDPVGDHANAATDVTALAVSSDANYIYFRLRFAAAVNWFDNARNNIFLDLDNNPATGYAIQGLGSELLIQRGVGYAQQAGVFNAGVVSGLSLNFAPQSDASEIEFSILRSVTHNSQPMVREPTIAVLAVSEDASSASREFVPNIDGYRHQLANASLMSGVPSAMTYQGRLTNASNAPVPDGTGYEIEVRLWSAPTGGTLLWGTRYTGVPLKSGAFNLILGSGGISIPGATHTDLRVAFNTPSVHLGLTTTKSATGANIPSPTEILPRQQIFSTPYAFVAATAATVNDGAITTSKIAANQITGAQIAPGAVGLSALAGNSIDSSKIVDGAIQPADFSPNVVSFFDHGLGRGLQPNRVWNNVSSVRAAETNYTNTFTYERTVYVRVGPASSGDSGAARIRMQVRQNDQTNLMSVAGTRTSTRFLQQSGDITGTVPAGWQFRITNTSGSGSFGIEEWNELY